VSVICVTSGVFGRQLALNPVAVEKVRFRVKRAKIRGLEVSRKLRSSFVGHPSAKVF
jgi:hypothetical protein